MYGGGSCYEVIESNISFDVFKFGVVVFFDNEVLMIRLLLWLIILCIYIINRCLNMILMGNGVRGL